MKGLIAKYEKAIKELEERIEFYKKELDNEKRELKRIEYVKAIVFYEGKKEALEEVLQGKDINMYLK